MARTGLLRVDGTERQPPTFSLLPLPSPGEVRVRLVVDRADPIPPPGFLVSLEVTQSPLGPLDPSAFWFPIPGFEGRTVPDDISVKLDFQALWCRLRTSSGRGEARATIDVLGAVSDGPL